MKNFIVKSSILLRKISVENIAFWGFEYIGDICRLKISQIAYS